MMVWEGQITRNDDFDLILGFEKGGGVVGEMDQEWLHPKP